MERGLSLYDREGAEADYIRFDDAFFANSERVLQKLQRHRADALDYRTVAVQYLRHGDTQTFFHMIQAGLRTALLVYFD